VELCSSLTLGGLTPPLSLPASLSAEPCRVNSYISVLVRPREGDFNYEPAEVVAMAADVANFRENCPHVSCVATGVTKLLHDGTLVVDTAAMSVIGAQLGGFELTFHRAIDEIIASLPQPTPQRMLHDLVDTIASTGAVRILTSGGSPSCLTGLANIATIVAHCRSKHPHVKVVACGGVSPLNAHTVITASAPHMLHASSSLKTVIPPTGALFAVERTAVDAHKVADLLASFETPPRTLPKTPRTLPKDTSPALTPVFLRGIVSTSLALANVSLAKAELSITLATASDVPAIMKQITDLAIYEKEPDAVNTTVPGLTGDGFPTDSDPLYYCLVIRDGRGAAVGMGLFFFAYSTWEGRMLYLEDLYVCEEVRGKGGGKAVMKALARVARDADCGRFVWQALDWNTPAINFYKSIGAQIHENWVNCRMEREVIDEFLREDN